MPSVAEQLNKVVEKTERLIELCAALQEENDLLKLESEALNVALKASTNKTKDLEEKLRVLKLAKSFSETNEKSVDIKQKINDFVQEIDKCIVLLKKLYRK
jgi:predicted  nucleic acid-binding Zn-ribbon protein